MTECSPVRAIHQRVSRDLHVIEWTLQHKRALRDYYREQGDHDLAAPLVDEIAKLEFEAGVHKAAEALTRWTR